MLKHAFLFIIGLIGVNTAFCKPSDTTILYYSYQYGVTARVSSLADADYFRMILPPDPGDNHRNVREFYKNGNVKLITKLSTDYLFSDFNHFDGDFISFYPDGKKLSIAHYTEGNLEGLEYRFYPSGRIYCTVKHQAMGTKILYWECYDTLGNQICTEGTGRFISHLEKEGFPEITSEGQVANGYAEGEWKGRIVNMFDFRFIAQYKRGKLISGLSYDKQGNRYPFTRDIEGAAYKTTVMEFVEDLNENIKLPQDANGKRESIDAYHLRCIIEKDGRISHPDILETKDTLLREAIATAIAKCYSWSPTRIVGVPVRTEVVVQLKRPNRREPDYKMGLLRLYQMYLTLRVLPDDEILVK
jgi:antitoxin component YwqK of YwqJK toxin-antitoxin module